jgi:hypothetical protein
VKYILILCKNVLCDKIINNESMASRRLVMHMYIPSESELFWRFSWPVNGNSDNNLQSLCFC